MLALAAEGGMPGRRPWPHFTRLAIVTAAGAVVVIAVTVVVGRRARQEGDVLAQVVGTFEAVQRQAVKLQMVTGQPEELRQYYRQTGSLPFSDTVMDLRPLGFQLVGGAVAQLGSMPSAMAVYRGPQGLLLCYRFRAEDVRLPPGGDDVGGDVYYARNGVTICIYRDGDMFCLMASALPRADLMKLLAGYV